MQPYPYPYLLEVSKDPLYRRINVSGFFKVIARAVITGLATGDPAQAVAAGSKETVRNLDHQLSTAHRAFELILNGMEAACLQLIQQEKLVITENEALLLSKRLEEKTQELDIQLTAHFFEAPQQLPAIQELVPVLVYWLEGLDLTSAQAAAIGQQLPRLFFRAVVQEWGRRREYYQPVWKHFEHPFVQAWEEEYNRERYYEELRELYHQPALGDELLPLSKIYQEPDFLVYEDCLVPNEEESNEEKVADYKDGFIGTEQFYSSLHHYLEDWLNGRSSEIEVKGKQLLILLGQPGQGKSSFCYKLIYDLLNCRIQNRKIYFLHFRNLSTREKIIKQPFELINEYFTKEKGLEEMGRTGVLLILDGLDELYMSDGLTDFNINKIYNKINHIVGERRGFKVIITARYNYVNIKRFDVRTTTIIRLAPFSLEQQIQWLRKYKEQGYKTTITEKILRKIHSSSVYEHDDNKTYVGFDGNVEITSRKESKFRYLKELLGQPILLYIIAKSDIDLSKDKGRYSVYKKLFDKIIKDSWQQLKERKGHHYLNESHFCENYKKWLSEISNKIYFNEYNYILYSELAELDSSRELEKGFSLPNGMSEIIKILLTSFYFKNTKRSPADSSARIREMPLEFLHKSFQEYLLVEFIKENLIKKLTKKIGKEYEMCSHKSVLKLFWRFFSRKEMDNNTLSLFVEMLSKMNSSVRKETYLRLKLFFHDCLKVQFFCKESFYEEPDNMAYPINRSIMVFDMYWLVMTNLQTDGEWPLNKETAPLYFRMKDYSKCYKKA